MPIIPSTFKTHFLLHNGHLQTIVAAVFRKSSLSGFTRERIITPDDDFLDLDWMENGNKKLVIFCHGLEGNSLSSYNQISISYLSKKGFDALAWSYRSCGGEMNKQLRFYHSGETRDLDFVIKHVIRHKKYEDIYLMGYSLGGNIVLKYIGEEALHLDKKIKAVVAVSAPVDLASSATKLEKPINGIYLKRFLKSLKKKIKAKATVFPQKLDVKAIDQLKGFYSFDDKYTAPIHGFKDALDYYQKSSALPFLKDIKIPALMISPLDDPFLSAECYPFEIAKQSQYLFLETPTTGGHLGFINGKNTNYYPAFRANSFFNQNRK